METFAGEGWPRGSPPSALRVAGRPECGEPRSVAEAWAGLHAELRVSALSCRLSPPSYLPAMSQRPERTGQEASELVCTVSTRMDGLRLALPRPAHLARVRREVALGHTAEALGAKGRAGTSRFSSGALRVDVRVRVRCSVCLGRIQLVPVEVHPLHRPPDSPPVDTLWKILGAPG